jgi:hypothetical protein
VTPAANKSYVSLPGKCKLNVLSLKRHFGYVKACGKSRKSFVPHLLALLDRQRHIARRCGQLISDNEAFVNNIFWT